MGGIRQLLPRLRALVTRLRGRWPKRPIALRADGEFAKPALLDYAEYAGRLYAIGLPRNPKLEARSQRLRQPESRPAGAFAACPKHRRRIAISSLTDCADHR
ncbi:MAG: transposase [Candidatus Binataceae bacterium]